MPLVCFCTIVLISTHAPRTGSDASSAMSTRLLARFQPTLPARGATRAPGCTMRRSDFNPRSPHGERQRFSLPEITGKSISTHAPRTGSDTTGAYLPQVVIGFQPTLPARGATGSPGGMRGRGGISTHAPRTGSDAPPTTSEPTVVISTHAPRTGSDLAADVEGFANLISTHAPRTGSDHRLSFGKRGNADFNPRSPHGERRLHTLPVSAAQHFNPRSPHGERHHTFFLSPS